jgi:fucose 4-O-acetylase-like acetyltransferase
MTMKPARLSWIDYARGIAIILVCYRHVFEGAKESGIAVNGYRFLEYFNIFFYSFRMPLFFIISGIFISRSLQKKGFKAYAETRARSILYPYFLWGFLQLSLQIIFTRYTNGHPTLLSYLDLFYLPREIAQFWYLYALFNVSLMYAVSKYFLKIPAAANIIIGLVLFYITSIFYRENIQAGFVFDIFHYYIFFGVGDFISSHLLSKKNQLYFESGKTLIAMLVVFSLVQTYFLIQNLNHSVSKYMYVEFYQPFIFLLIAFTGCAFIINLTFFLQKKDILAWLRVLGRHSLYIYVSHVIIFSFIRIALSKFLGVENIFIILLSGMLCGLIIPVWLYRLAVKWNIRWIFTLEKNNENRVAAPAGSNLTV